MKQTLGSIIFGYDVITEIEHLKEVVDGLREVIEIQKQTIKVQERAISESNSDYSALVYHFMEHDK